MAANQSDVAQIAIVQLAPNIKRPLPTLKQWLDERLGEDRGEGFEFMAALADLARRTLEQNPDGLPANEACFLRLWQGIQVAAIELCNIEHKAKVPQDIIVSMLPRVMACASFYAVASIAKDDTPWRGVAKLLTEEFRATAKQCADAMEAREP